MSKVLFAGPSIHGLGLQSEAELVLRPPAGCGDILSAVHAGFDMIGLVDGVFGTERSVWHKEILFALSSGVRVLGAASMGALRAAECDAFGMEGIGRIYRDYRDGRRIDDADVALLHGPKEMAFQPLTLALVDAEATIAELHAYAGLSEEQKQVLLGAARNLHFRERSWTAILGRAQAAPGFRRLVDAFLVEQKKVDALELIVRMHEQAPAESAKPWILNETLYLTALEESLS
ncbi:MAG TPA: TfuA-like protein [Rhizomicrobium sp.]|nr:TfuA-like protein [Rhizomicrobium sp.]